MQAAADAAHAVDSHRLVERVALEVFGAGLDERLVAARLEYVLAAGTRSLDQCFGLPRTAGKRRKQIRNAWLSIAQDELRATGDDATAGALHERLVHFVHRGPWRHWHGGPPSDAANLHCALWHAVKANEGRVLSCKHLEALLKNRPRNFHMPALTFVLR